MGEKINIDFSTFDAVLKSRKIEKIIEVPEQAKTLKDLDFKILTSFLISYKQAEEFEKLYQFEKASRCYLKLAQQFLKDGDRKSAGPFFTKSAICMYYIGKYSESFEYYQYALDITEQLGNLREKGELLTNIGMISYAQGELDGALDHYKRSLDIAEQLGDLRLQSQDLSLIGIILYDRGDLNGALNHYKHALDIAEQLNDLEIQSGILPNIGVILLNEGDLGGAINNYKHALGTLKQLSDLKGKDQILPNIGMKIYDRGDLNGALNHYKQILDIAEQLGDLTIQSQISLETTSIVAHLLLEAFHRDAPKKHQYDNKKFIELIRRVLENKILLEFTDLEELSKSAFNRNSNQIDLKPFQDLL